MLNLQCQILKDIVWERFAVNDYIMNFFRDALRIYLSLQSDLADNNIMSDDHKKIGRENSEMARKSRIDDMPKHYVRYEEGAVLYSMCQKTFEKLAKEADAIREYGRIRLINVKKVDDFIELMCHYE